MARNQIVINVDIGETRVALIENGIVTELHIERRNERNVVGDVYLGKVTRVLPGMNAAFVDIGLERAAFLHIEDALSEGDLRAMAPDDDVEHEEAPGARTTPTPALLAPAHAHLEGGESAALAGEAGDEEEGDEEEGDEEEAGERASEGGEEGTGRIANEDGDATLADLISDADGAPSTSDKLAAPSSRARNDKPVAGGGGGAGGGGRDGRRGGGGGNRHSKGGGRGRRKDARGQDAAHRGAREGGGRDPGRSGDRPGDKPTGARGPKPIREVLREGQEVVVQVSKGPISTKGARCTSHISLPGRYVVYMPTVEHVGVSKRIGNEKERKRLREVIEQLRPEKGGVIVRTVSDGLTKKELKNDVGYLVHVWGDIWKKREGARAPSLLYSELDVVLRTVRDVMGPDIEKIVIDDKEAHARCVRFVEQFMPDRKDDVMLYSGAEPVFDEYGIEDEIGRALSRKVPLKSGGYLIIDQAEALTAIDVNSGRFVGKKDVEDTVTQTNMEAVNEIAYQLRLRNLGGLIILDLIDMDRQGNRDRVYKALNEALKQDKAKTSILRISELGLVEMTRKRTRESLGRQLYEPCFYCDGTGHTQSKLTIAYEIMRQIRREKGQLAGYTIVVNAHPAVADALKHDAKEVVEEAERRYMRRIVVTSKPEYHIEQFDLMGR